MANPWDNDPIVQANAAPSVQSAPWTRDPIVQPNVAPASPARTQGAPPPPAAAPIATPAQLSPDQLQKYYQELQTTPLNPNPPTEQGVGRRALGGLLQPYTGIAAGLEQGAANVFGSDALRQAAENSYLFGAQTQPGMISGAARMAGALPEMMLPGAGSVAAGANTAANELLGAQQTNQPIDLKEVATALASGGTDAAMNYLLGKGISGSVAKDIIRQLPASIGETGAKVIGRVGAGALMGGAGQAAQNVIHGRPVGENVIGAAGQMGAMEVGGGALHDFAQQPAPRSEIPTAEELSPEAAQVHQAITEQGDRLDRLAEQYKDVQPEPEPQPSPTVQRVLAEHPAGTLDADAVAEQAAAVDPDVKAGATDETAATQDYVKGELDSAHGENTNYSLQDIPLDSLKLNEDYQPEKVQEYASQPAATAPPIIMGKDGAVIDGNTRARAALARGETTIKGYAPVQPTEQPVGLNKEPTPFQQRTLGSAVQTKANQWQEAVGSAWQAANRLLGTGLGVGKEEAGVRSRLMAVGSNLDADRTVLEQAMKPARDTMNTWSPEAKTTWIEQLEAGQPSTDPALEPEAKTLRDLNKSLRSRAEAVGMDTSSWNPTDDWVGRLAEWPQAGQGQGTSLSGPETFLRNRKFKTFGEFKQAVEETGGRLRYDNPLDMAVAKLNEVNRSVTGREFLQNEQAAGTVKRFAAGQEIPENWEVINDKLATDRGDQYAMPPRYARELNNPNLPASKRITRFQELRDAGELVKLPKRTAKTDVLTEGGDLQARQVKAQLAEGTGPEPFPPGHMLVDPLLSQVADKGQLAAPKPIADMLNQFIAPGLPKGSIFDRMAEVTRMTTLANFSMSAFHAVTTGASNAYLGIRQALDNVLHGEFSLAAKNVGRAINPIGSIKWGSEVRQQLAGLKNTPELAPLADAIRESGARSGTPTTLNPTAWQQAINAYRTGDRAEAGVRFAQSATGAISHAIMGHLVPNAKLASLAMAAETATERGLTGDALRTHMQEASRLADNVAGQVVRSNQFQHRIVQNVMDLVMTAPKFAEGAIRIYGGATVDTLKGLADAVQGKAPRLTANQQAVLAHLLVHGVIAGTTQAIATAVNGKMELPASFKDLWYPKTGRKNTDGSDERLSLPDPLGVIPALIAEGPKKALVNRINPVWRAIGDVVTNSDYRGVQVRSGNVAEQTLQSVAHLGKAALPWSVQQAAQPARPDQPVPSAAQRAGAFLGVRTAPASLSRSDAANKLHDLAAQNVPAQSRTAEEADRSSTITALATAIRNKQPDARQRLNDAIRTGTILPADRATVFEKAAGEPGLVGDLQRSSLDAKESIQVWDAATDEEKRKLRPVLLSKIANSKTLQPAERKALRQHVLDDLNQLAGAR